MKISVTTLPKIAIYQTLPYNLFIVLFHHHHHQSVLPKGRFFTANAGTKGAVLPGIIRWGCFTLLSAPYSLFSIWRDLQRSEKIPGAPVWRCGEWLWLTGPSGLHRNSPQGLNISSNRVFDQISVPEIPIILRPLVLFRDSITSWSYRV